MEGCVAQLVAAPCPAATYICNRKAPGPLGVWPRSRNLEVVQLSRSHWSGRAYIGFPFACSPDPNTIHSRSVSRDTVQPCRSASFSAANVGPKSR